MRDFDLPGRSPVLATNGMCATSHPHAAGAAIDLLKAGGNAVDAAIAAAMVLNIAEPHMCGLAGDCFVLLRPPGQDRIIGLNGSGRAPAGQSAASLRNAGLAEVPTDSVHAVTLPGAVDALCRLSADWGRLGLEAALAPAIAYARDGIPVAPRVAFDWSDAAARLAGSARGFYLSGGRTPKVGEMFSAPGQVEVLERIARLGRAGFYEGPVAEDMVSSLRALGGTHTADDFAKTESFYTEPVSGRFGPADLVEHAPNGQGATAILLLNILSHFDLAGMDPFGAERAHIEAEATKLAYDARNRFIADPDHTTRLAHMLAPETAAGLAALIDPGRAMPVPPPAAGAVHRDTVLVTVVDRDRMAVSLIYSIYFGFGSGLASDRFGLLFQNRGAGFCLTPGHPNELAGGKRPMHTIIPAMLRQPDRLMAFGVMGGAYQPAGHARFVTNHLTYGLDLQEAIDAPRCFAGPQGLAVERGYSQKVRAALQDKGHQILEAEEPLGGAQAISIEPSGILIGGSDPRKDGIALGY
jgi:gamma-glutamyltranspeptidase/glutathione hydrolase